MLFTNYYQVPLYAASAFADIEHTLWTPTWLPKPCAAPRRYWNTRKKGIRLQLDSSHKLGPHLGLNQRNDQSSPTWAALGEECMRRLVRRLDLARRKKSHLVAKNRMPSEFSSLSFRFLEFVGILLPRCRWSKWSRRRWEGRGWRPFCEHDEPGDQRAHEHTWGPTCRHFASCQCICTWIVRAVWLLSLVEPAMLGRCSTLGCLVH